MSAKARGATGSRVVRISSSWTRYRSAGWRSAGATYRGGERVDEPLDFTEKNRMSLADLQRALCMVVKPGVDAGGAGISA